MNPEDPNLHITEVTQHIYLGSYEHPLTNSEDFEKLKIDVVFNFSTEVDYNGELNCFVENFPIADGDSISFVENMDKAVEKMYSFLVKKKKIYLHSVKGASRAPAILIYYMMRYKKFNYDRAYRLIKKMRPKIAIEPELQNVLQSIDDIDD